jgi:integrase
MSGRAEQIKGGLGRPTGPMGVHKMPIVRTVAVAGSAYIMTNSNLRLVTPITENRTVAPQRPPNAELRTREHLTADEVEKLIEAAKANRYGYRDALMVLLAYRHGLRAAEVVDLRWD